MFNVSWQKEDAFGNKSTVASEICDSYSVQWGGTHIVDDFIPHITGYVLILTDDRGEIDLDPTDLAWIEFAFAPTGAHQEI